MKERGRKLQNGYSFNRAEKRKALDYDPIPPSPVLKGEREKELYLSEVASDRAYTTEVPIVST